MKKIVVLDNPLSNFDNPIVKELFTETMFMKFRGFRQHWSQWYIPVCKTDFVGTNMILCDETPEGKLKPISAVRGITKERCERYRLSFPASTLCKHWEDQRHQNVLDDWVSKMNGRNIAYCSAFTVEQFLPREEKKEAVESLIALFAFYHMHFKVEQSVAIGAEKTRTDEYYHRLGLFGIKHEGKALPNVNFPELDNAPFEVQLMESLSPECIEAARSNIRLWKDAIIIEDNTLKKGSVESYLNNVTLSKPSEGKVA
jgi:hypothetical protein